jgi:hypothetical protein
MLTQADQIQPKSVLLEGNYFHLQNFFQKQLGKNNLRIAFFGDHYMSDVDASALAKSDQATWEAIAVIEELANYDCSLWQGSEPDNVMTQNYWGPDYFFELTNGKRLKNFFVNEAAKVSRYAIPFMKSITLLMQ